MSKKAYSQYLDQIDKYFMECNSTDFATKTMNLLSFGFADPFLTPSEYLQLCKYRASLVIVYG